jgi:ribosomal protein L20
VHQHGLNYSRFVNGMLKADVRLNRKVIMFAAATETSTNEFLPLHPPFIFERSLFLFFMFFFFIWWQVLADLAVTEPLSFKSVVETVKSARAV